MSITTKHYNFDKLKVGILSDMQLSPFSWRDNNQFGKNLVSSLSLLKELDCNFLMIAGDIANLVSKYAYKTFVAKLDEVYGDNKPIMQIIMGNHDYFTLRKNSAQREFFAKHIGCEINTHLVINGYHFIGVSPDCKSMTDGYSSKMEYIEERIQIALKDDMERAKPIFVMTHNGPSFTSYGTHEWGDNRLNAAFKCHPNVVLFSGHVHYSLMDDRSIMQSDYTAINTQSTSYVEMEVGKANGSVPPLAYTTPMVMTMEIGDNEVIIKRHNVLLKKEEYANRAWKLALPLRKESFVYQADRDSDSPRATSSTGICKMKNGHPKLVFSAFECNDIIHSYKVLYSTGEVQYYYSDYYKGESAMVGEIELSLFRLKKGTYTASVYAINCFGKISEDCVSIEGIKVNKKRRYRKVLAPENKFGIL